MALNKDYVPLLAQVLGQAAAGLGKSSNNPFAENLGNIAASLGRNAAYAAPEGWGKYIDRYNQGKVIKQSGPSSVSNVSNITPKQFGAAMGPQGSGEQQMNPFVAMALSPAEQNAMTARNLEQQRVGYEGRRLGMEEELQPYRVESTKASAGYTRALTGQAEASTEATKKSWEVLTPAQQVNANLEQQRINIQQQLANSNLATDSTQKKLLDLKYEQIISNQTATKAYLNATSTQGKINAVSAMTPDLAIEFLKANQKNDTFAKTYENFLKAYTQAAIDPDPEEVHQKILKTIKNMYLGEEQIKNPQGQQGQQGIPTFNPDTGQFE